MKRTYWMCGIVIAALACGATCSSHEAGTDAGLDAGHDAGIDAGTDAGLDAGTDAGLDAGPPGLTCHALLTCDNACGSSNSCTNNCYAESTAVAQGLFNALNNCISENCSSGDGGPCASPSSSACATCNQTAATSACVTNLESCFNDSVVAPPDPDGGAIVPDGGDTGPALNCGELIACVGACPADAGASCASGCNAHGTPEAVALAGALNGCLAMACPTTDGGVCATPGAACDGCIDQAEYALPDTCAVQFVSCNTDHSNAPDASVTPTSLLDGGVLSTLVTGIVQPASALVVRNNFLYFVFVDSDSQVLRVPLGDGGTFSAGDGGTVTHLGPPQQTPVGLAIDANNIYVWSTGSFSGTSFTNNDDGTVVQIPLDGGAAITLAQNMEVFYNAPYINSVAVDSQYVYWVSGGTGTDGVIWRTAIGNTSAVQLYPHQALPEAIATDGTNVYWTNWGTFDAAGNSNNDGTVMQASVNGGAILTLASNQSAPAAIVVDSSNVYWTNSGRLGGGLLPAPNSGSVMQVPIGGSHVTTLASGQAVPLGIAVANGSVYWTNYGLSGPGLVLGVPIGGGTAIPLVAGLPDPYTLIAYGNTLYWTNTPSSDGNGTIMSLSPF